MTYLVDIIIPTFNQEEFTIQCISSIVKNTRDYRIIWVDNGSEESSRRTVEEVLSFTPHLHIQNPTNQGFVQAVNRGLEASNSQYIVILNNDTIVTPEWFDNLKRVFQSQNAVGLVGPLTSTDGSWQGINRLRTDPRFADDFADLPEVNLENHPDQIADILKNKFCGQSVEIRGMIAFFCVLTSKEVVEKVGLLSEDYGLGFCDDDDYCIRVRNAGFKLFVAKDTFIYHFHRTTFRSLFDDDQIKEMIKNNKTLFKQKWHLERMPFYKQG
jgi:GT2 family glycosyltransferase